MFYFKLNYLNSWGPNLKNLNRDAEPPITGFIWAPAQISKHLLKGIDFFSIPLSLQPEFADLRYFTNFWFCELKWSRFEISKVYIVRFLIWICGKKTEFLSSWTLTMFEPRLDEVQIIYIRPLFYQLVILIKCNLDL